MGIELTGRGPRVLGLTRAALAVCALLVAGSLGACTTVEGTNAMSDFGTFEREVMTSTLQGLGAVPQETKEPLVTRRGPLVLPKANAPVESPQAPTKTAEALPADSSAVQIDVTGLSQADIDRLKRARIVDLRTLAGRPLTEAEARQLTARFQGAQLKGKRALTLPPDEYFTVVDGKDMVCLSETGEIVPLDSIQCPTVVRRALGPQGATGAPSFGSGKI